MIMKVTEQHLKEARKTPVYKVVRVEEDGRLKSLWISGTKESPIIIVVDGRNIPAYALTYKPNRVISNGRYGIWCSRSLKAAVNQANNNGHGQLCKIYKVYPIGKPISPPEGWNDAGTVLYPAVIMERRCVKVIDVRHRRSPYA